MNSSPPSCFLLHVHTYVRTYVGDELEGLDTTNIIQGGRRTRGARIDYSKIQLDSGDEDEDDDEEDDE